MPLRALEGVIEVTVGLMVAASALPEPNRLSKPLPSMQANDFKPEVILPSNEKLLGHKLETLGTAPLVGATG